MTDARIRSAVFAPAFTVDRRALLAGLGAGAAACALGAGRAVAQGAPDLAWRPLADGVALVTGAGGNVAVVQGPEGAVLLNGGAPEQARTLLDFVAANTGNAPVTALFNTDWHPRNTGANDVLGPAGVQIVAHKNTALWMGADFAVDWEGVRYAPRAEAARPTRTFYTTDTVQVGAHRLNAEYALQAHTDGDIHIHLPEANVLFAGGIVSKDAWPALDWCTGGWIGGNLDGLLRMIEISDDATQVIGEYGAPMTRADMQAQYDMLLALKERFLEMMKEGMGPDDMLAAGATAEYDAARGDPELFVHQAYGGILWHLREVGGIIA